MTPQQWSSPAPAVRIERVGSEDGPAGELALDRLDEAERHTDPEDGQLLEALRERPRGPRVFEGHQAAIAQELEVAAVVLVGELAQRVDEIALPREDLLVTALETSRGTDFVDRDDGHHRGVGEGRGARWRERRPESRPPQLAQLDRLGDVADAMRAEGAEGEVFREVARGHCGRRARDHDLTTVRDRPDAGTVVDQRPDVVAVPGPGLADQDARPDRHARVVTALQVRGGSDRLRCLRERDEVAVALTPRLDHRSSVGRRAGVDVRIEGTERGLHLRRSGVPRAAAGHHVGHEERDDPRWQRFHQPSRV